MDCFSGEEAFDKVLEALLDAHFNARQASERQNDAEARAREAEREAGHLAGKVRRLEQEGKNAMPKLAELWQAAKALDDTVRIGYSNGTTVTPSSDCITRLRAALESAAGYCDEIPF
jgi:hypothetical protein